MFAKWKSKLKAALKEANDKRNGRNSKHTSSEALAEPVVTIEKQSDGLSRPCECSLVIAPIAIACGLLCLCDPAEGTQGAGLALTADACCCCCCCSLQTALGVESQWTFLQQHKVWLVGLIRRFLGTQAWPTGMCL
jgi:hypothetical protein